MDNNSSNDAELHSEEEVQFSASTKMAISGLWQRVKSERVAVAARQGDESEQVIHDGSLEYTREIGGNGSKPSYQEASGAPVEKVSPLGYEISWFTVVFLNIGQMIGTGVFSTRMFLAFRLGLSIISGAWTKS